MSRGFSKKNDLNSIKHLVRVRRHTVVTQRCFTTRCSVTHYDLNIVWNAICHDLPILDELLRPIVESFPEEQNLPDNLDEFI